jgi:hypothetical protein
MIEVSRLSIMYEISYSRASACKHAEARFLGDISYTICTGTIILLRKIKLMDDKKHKVWQSSWASPISLGIFLLTATLALAVLLYTVLNIVGAIESAMHPASVGDAMTQQEMQQLEQAQPAATGAPSMTGQQ